MLHIKRALVSVSDKTGLVEFVSCLNRLGVEILSTGGTAKLLRESGLKVIDVSEYTGFPEILDGRVKTLHPKVHAGLLAVRDNPKHMAKIKEYNIGLIDMVVVNLYPFEETIKKPKVTFEEAIENIDIGGPSMLRSAAKNFKSIAVVSTPIQYPGLIEELNKHNGKLGFETLTSLGKEVYKLTSRYDAAISEFLNNQGKDLTSVFSDFPEHLCARFTKIQDLRYGENPHQKAAFYRDLNQNKGIAYAKQLHGKELSFNNILDLNSAFELVKEFKNPAVVILKHNNPCGAGESDNLKKAFIDAWKCDKLSAFGGIVGLNRKVDLLTAGAISKSGFLECIIAPGYDLDALELLKSKKNVRILELDFSANNQTDDLDIRTVSGGALAQNKDSLVLDLNSLKVVSKVKPTKAQMASLLFAWKVAKHVKSNAIILAKGTKTVGIGAGQMSRVDSVYIAVKKAGKSNTKGASLASDAFFPKEDAVVMAIKSGIRAIIHPGGSIADEAIIKVADKYKIAMVTTGLRHFRH
jgi:phosphoribosylaminoimidazolecarboxamide formyltransferase/IMP cyclohydrolase